jgi:hypothetical protein
MSISTGYATAAFWVASLERAVKTFAQSLAALLVADGVDLLSIDWGEKFSIAGMAALVSLLTSVGSDMVTDDPGPSLTNSERTDLAELTAPGTD